MARSLQNVAKAEARGPAIIERARQVFIEVAERHGLAVEWDAERAVELACTISKQPGLDWDLWLCVQNNDELHIQNELFTFSWFPADKPAREAEFVEALEGLISGACQLRCFYRRSRPVPDRVHLERKTNGKLEQLHSYWHGVHFGRFSKIEIVRNGYETVAL